MANHGHEGYGTDMYLRTLEYFFHGYPVFAGLCEKYMLFSSGNDDMNKAGVVA